MDSSLVPLSYRSKLDLMTGLAHGWKLHFNQSNPSLSGLAGEFENFAAPYFEKVTSLISPETAAKRDWSSLDSAIDRLQNEWVTINNACQQRLFPGEMTSMTNNLKMADDLAAAYFKRFQGYKPNDSAPVVYFEKDMRINRYMFTPYALISVPFTIANIPSEYDWLALAHEIGHYIFWNSAPIGEYRRLHEELKQRIIKALPPVDETSQAYNKHIALITLWMKWLEETFADVSATLLGGVRFVRSSLIRAKNTFDTNDTTLDSLDEHPSNMVRPVIAIAALQWLADHLQNAEGTTTTDHQRGGKLHEFIEVPSIGANLPALVDYWEEIRKEEFKLLRTDTQLTQSEIETSIPAVINAIMTTLWIGVDQTKMPFYTLFKVTEWLDTLLKGNEESLPIALPSTPSAQEPRTVAPLLSTGREHLANMIHEIQNVLMERSQAVDEANTLKALLDFDLGEERGLCKWCCKKCG